MVYTLKSLLEAHPEWADIEIVLYTDNCMARFDESCYETARVYASDICLDLIVYGGTCDGNRENVDCLRCKEGRMKDVLVFAAG